MIEVLRFRSLSRGRTCLIFVSWLETLGMTTGERLAYPLREAALIVGLSPRSLRYLIKSGKLGYAKVGRRILITDEELRRFLRRASVKPTTILDADESIRPKNRTAPSYGKLEAAN
jgi:excisionase family DNA binding protein